jgi:selenocysteine lyase/cysteine desulfurase
VHNEETGSMPDTGMSRRRFVRTVAGGALGGAVLTAFPDNARAKYVLARETAVSPHDEEFWAFVREQFPLRRDPLYLNNGTMGPSPYVVIDAVRAEMETVDREGKYGGWDDVRPAIARFVHAAPEEIALTHNVTEGINIVASGLPLKRGDEVIVSNHEHAGNAIPWLARARRDGIVVRAVSLAATAAETLNRINDAITGRTRVIALPHVTCTTGQVLPGRAISALGHDRGLWVMLDGAHTPGMIPCDVQDLGCDFFATCGHKWMMGPKGTGFLVVRKEMLEVLEPSWVGGGVDTGWDVTKGTLSYRADAHRFDFASQSAALYTGLGAAIDFLYHLGMTNVAARGRELAAGLRRALEKLGERVTILTPEEPGASASLLSFRLASTPFDTLHTVLREKHHIITRMVPENGVNCIRVSTHIYNSEAEVRHLVDAIAAIA